MKECKKLDKTLCGGPVKRKDRVSNEQNRELYSLNIVTEDGTPGPCLDQSYK